MEFEESGLYGIRNSNRKPDEHWGKNCFNSSFPTALACYMMGMDATAVYVHLEDVGGQLKVVNSEIPLKEVFNCGDREASELDFHFESVYEPYRRYAFGNIDAIDLVVKDVEGRFLAPLEIKLTVLPTSATGILPEDRWGCELVVRAATTSYCALGMFDALADDPHCIRDILEDSCSSIRMWDNDFEMSHKVVALARALDDFERRFLYAQKPLVVQALWKTKGVSPILDEHAFDLVVWSDYAFTRLFVDDVISKPGPTMSRPMRATARLGRCLWELSKSGKIHLSDIYRQMAFGNQTDKEFAVGGTKWRRYVTSERIMEPIVPRDAVTQIVDEESIERLSPERRLDQTLYFTARL